MSKSNPTKKSKKLQKASFGLNNKKAVLVLVAVLFIAIGVGSLLQTFASAQTTLKVCNSSASARMIKVFKLNDTLSYSKWFSPGQCSPKLNNTGWNPIRVDTGSYGSYKKGPIGVGYDDCVNGRNYFSNPENDAPEGVRYRNYDIGNCDF